MASQWLTHKGKKIYRADFARKDANSLRAEMDAATLAIKQLPAASVLFLSDTRGTLISPAVLGLLRDKGQETLPYIRRMAMLGIDGAARRALLDTVLKFLNPKSPTKTFDDEAAALEWLVG